MTRRVICRGIAKDRSAMAKIRAAVAQVPTHHRLLLGDARCAILPAKSVHLVLTSPPYWTLKEYRRAEGQLGWVADYDEFLDQLDQVWRMCHTALVPGGRLSAWWVTSVWPGARTVVGIPWSRCMLPSRSVAGHSGSTISRRSSGTRSRTRRTRWSEGRAAFWGSRTNRTP